MDNPNNTNIIFSILNGYNFYKIKNISEEKVNAEHYLNSMQVDIICDSPLVIKDMWKHYIEKPPVKEFAFWPIDIVELSSNSKLKNNGNLGLVFKKKAYPKLETFKSFVWDETKIGLEKDSVRKLILTLLKRLIDLENDGYIYNAFDLERIYYDPTTFEVYINFALSTTIKTTETFEKCKMLKNDISIDFLPPWNKDGCNEYYVNSNQHRFSIAALLFKILIGRMPYQGRMFDGYGDILDYRRDTDKSEHIEFMKNYLDIDVFIFDEENKENSIGTFQKEEKYIERWNLLDESIRNMFYNVFSVSNKQHEHQDLYSLEEWYDVLNRYN